MLIAFLALTAVGISIWFAAGRHSLENRVYRIGWEIDPPEQVRGDNGEPTGIAVELVREAAKRRGIRLEWVYRQDSSEAALRGGYVDLWPIMTITPERARVLHISPPFLETTHCLLVRSDSPAGRLGDLSESRIGYSGLPLNRLLLTGYLPKAQLVIRPPNELIKGVCARDIDAAFIEEHAAIAALLAGGGCPGQALKTIPANGPRLQLGVGSTFQAAAAANAIQEEIGRMAAEGLLAPLLAKWGYLTGRSQESIHAMLRARQRERWLIGFIGLFGLLLVLAVWQARRATRESKRATRSALELRGSERRFHDLFENVQLLGVISDRQGSITFANRFTRQVTGWTRADLIGQQQIQFFPKEYHEQVNAASAAAYGGKGAVTFLEAPIRTKDGQTRWIQWHGTTLRDATGKVVGLATLGVDLTEHKALQEQYLQVQKLDSLGRLAGGVAHDFNNLLTVINGYSDMILGEGKGSPLHSAIAEIRSAGERGKDLTQQLLAFSRKQVIRPRVVNLNDLIDGSLKMLQRLVGEDIEIVIRLEPGLGSVLADPGQLHQVIMNLAVNSREAMSLGGTFTLRTANIDVDERLLAEHPAAGLGSFVLIEVNDTGAGIAEEVRQHIFEPFFTTKGTRGGTGLGLATVYGIVQQSHGTISVRSEPGRGTTFSIYLPRTTEPPVKEAGEAERRKERCDSETLLIVEDQDGVRHFVVGVLKSLGYKVMEFGTGSEALLAVEQHVGPIHLLLTDVVMPGMNGKELAGRVKLLRPEIRVVYMSGYAADVISQRGLLDPGVQYIAKPFSRDALAARIRETLDQP